MHNNDPRVVEHTEAVRQLNFEEAAELAYFGAKILHPTCVQPAKYAGIPVRLKNTMDPKADGTIIDNVIVRGKIKAVAAKDNITAIKSRVAACCSLQVSYARYSKSSRAIRLQLI